MSNWNITIGYQTKKDIICISYIFCYIFSFYIVGPITSSIIAGIPFIIKYRLNNDIYNGYSRMIITLISVLSLLCLCYSTFHFTFDYSYLKVLFGQLINIIMGIYICYGLKNKYSLSCIDIERYIVLAFCIQSVIEVVAFIFPPFASLLIPFNRAHNFTEQTVQIRGLALSAGTGWSLALSYGLAFIILVKRFFLNHIGLKSIILGVLLIVGTMFAGRTGFVGAAIGAILFILNNNTTLNKKIIFIFKVLIVIILLCLIFYIIFPEIANYLIEYVFPFAFEPFYRLYYNDEFSTSSTDTLGEMWEVEFTIEESILGTGYFTDPISGSYYRHIDIGIIRNLLYWGIGGYVLLIAYQLLLTNPIKQFAQNKNRWNIKIYHICIILYLFAMEFKAMTIGFNKMAMSICLILGLFYYYDRK